MIVSLIFLITSLGQSNSARILCVFPTPSKHQTIYQTLSVELSLRGHRVTVITADPLNDETLVNLTEIEISTLNDIEKRNQYQMEKIAKNSYIVTRMFYTEQYFKNFAEEVLSHIDTIFPDSSTDFDLIILENVHHLIYSLGCRFEAPIIAISSKFVPFFDDPLDLPTHGATFFDFNHMRSGLLQRTEDVIFGSISKILYRWYFLYHSNTRGRYYFGNNCPHIATLLTNISLLVTYTNSVAPRLPFHVNIDGPLSVRPKETLPQDIENFLQASQVVIYVNLCPHVPENVRNVVNRTLEELPYSVLWQAEDDWSYAPKHIMVKKFLPQDEILAHQKVKVFVTCGDQESVEESVGSGVSLIFIPFAFDHFPKVRRLVDLGVAQSVDYATLTKGGLRDVVIEAVENHKYKKALEDLKASVKERPMTNLEKSLWWIEYVMDHHGASHLKSYTDNASWFQYFLIDEILFFTAVITMVIIGLILLYKKILLFLLGTKEKTN